MEELNRSYGTQDESPARLTTAATNLELDITRPRWTWHWHLPFLTHLHVTSEFAYLFKFKFIQGCPALKTLWLDIRSTIPGEHTRVISEAELSASSSNSISLSSSQPTTDHLSLPCLSRLGLSGKQTIHDNVMQQLLTRTLPKVEQFYLQLWTMNTLESLLRVLQAQAQNHDDNGNEPLAFFITNPSLEDMAHLGIVEDTSFQYRMNGDGVDGDRDYDTNDFLEVSLATLGHRCCYRF